MEKYENQLLGENDELLVEKAHAYCSFLQI